MASISTITISVSLVLICAFVFNNANAQSESFIIFKNSTKTYSIDEITNTIKYSGSDFFVLNATINDNISSEVKLMDNNYTISNTLVISKPINIHGNTQTWITFPHKTTGARIIYNGTYVQNLVNITNTRGVILENLAFDGRNNTSYDIFADRMKFSKFSNISLVNGGFWLGSTSQGVGDNAFFNLFENFNVQAPIAIILSGINGFNCACQNNFINTNVNYWGNYGIDGQVGDNNDFYSLYVSKGSGTGHAVHFSSVFVNNYFYDVELTGGLIVDANNNGNTIFGYDKGNGEPEPVLGTNSYLSLTEDGSQSKGWQITKFNVLFPFTITDYNNLGFNLLYPYGNDLKINSNSTSRYIQFSVNPDSSGYWNIFRLGAHNIQTNDTNGKSCTLIIPTSDSLPVTCKH